MSASRITPATDCTPPRPSHLVKALHRRGALDLGELVPCAHTLLSLTPAHVPAQQQACSTNHTATWSRTCMDRTVEEVARGILVFVDAHAVAVALAEQEQRPALPLRRRLRSPPRRRATRSATRGAAGLAAASPWQRSAAAVGRPGRALARWSHSTPLSSS